MQQYITEITQSRVGEIISSMSNEFPPWYVEDYSQYRNCYSHIFDIYKGYESRDVFLPGKISELAHKTDIEVINCPFYEIYGTEKIVKAVISDAGVLKRNAIRTEIDAPYTTSDAYKIFLCEDVELGLWHFTRESLTETGQKIFSHKISYKMPTGILTKDKNYFYSYDSKYIVLATLELSPKK